MVSDIKMLNPVADQLDVAQLVDEAYRRLTLPALHILSEGETDWLNSLAQLNHQWRLTWDSPCSRKGPVDECKTCTRAFQAVRTAFSHDLAKNEIFLLAAVTSFQVLCEIDDQSEKLVAEGKTAAALATLRSCISIMDEDSASMPNTPVWEDMPFKMESMANKYPSETALTVLKTRLRQLFGYKANLDPYFNDVRNNFLGCITEYLLPDNEMTFRSYLDYRVETISAKSYCSLYILAAGGDVEYDAETMDQLCIAIAMQNDLLGLQKDLITGDTNPVIVLSSNGHMSFENAVNHLVAVHNRSVSEFYIAGNHLKEKESLVHQVFCSFLSGHAYWARTSKRYATVINK